MCLRETFSPTFDHAINHPNRSTPQKNRSCYGQADKVRTIASFPYGKPFSCYVIFIILRLWHSLFLHNTKMVLTLWEHFCVGGVSDLLWSLVKLWQFGQFFAIKEGGTGLKIWKIWKRIFKTCLTNSKISQRRVDGYQFLDQIWNRH
jgi:hypothetical protein